jgi:hypothetical protein
MNIKICTFSEPPNKDKTKPALTSSWPYILGHIEFVINLFIKYIILK